MLVTHQVYLIPLYSKLWKSEHFLFIEVNSIITCYGFLTYVFVMNYPNVSHIFSHYTNIQSTLKHDNKCEG